MTCLFAEQSRHAEQQITASTAAPISEVKATVALRTDKVECTHCEVHTLLEYFMFTDFRIPVSNSGSIQIEYVLPIISFLLCD